MRSGECGRKTWRTITCFLAFQYGTNIILDTRLCLFFNHTLLTRTSLAKRMSNETPVMADETCSRCEKPAPRPVLACLVCVDGLDEDGDSDRTYYCSTRCQFADRKDHTKLCADTNIRKQIFRAGAILMAAL